MQIESVLMAPLKACCSCNTRVKGLSAVWGTGFQVLEDVVKTATLFTAHCINVTIILLGQDDCKISLELYPEERKSQVRAEPQKFLLSSRRERC